MGQRCRGLKLIAHLYGVHKHNLTAKGGRSGELVHVIILEECRGRENVSAAVLKQRGGILTF